METSSEKSDTVIVKQWNFTRSQRTLTPLVYPKSTTDPAAVDVISTGYLRSPSVVAGNYCGVDQYTICVGSLPIFYELFSAFSWLLGQLQRQLSPPKEEITQLCSHNFSYAFPPASRQLSAKSPARRLAPSLGQTDTRRKTASNSPADCFFFHFSLTLSLYLDIALTATRYQVWCDATLSPESSQSLF